MNLTDLTDELMLNFGQAGETIIDIAGKCAVTSHDLVVHLAVHQSLHKAFQRGKLLYHDAYRKKLEPLIKEAFIKKIEEGDKSTILWAMENIVLDDTSRLPLFDQPAAAASIVSVFQSLPISAEELERGKRLHPWLNDEPKGLPKGS